MRRSNPILVLVTMLACIVSGQPSSFELPVAPQEKPIKWATRSIQISLSTSLSSPSPAVKPDSDVLGAVERALTSWSNVANVTFVKTTSKAQSVSPLIGGDGVNLITIAGTTENLALFDEGNTTARTRVFYDKDTGEITEADIVINPYPYSEKGAALQFSTDGTAGTYDLESTLAHEIGHLLGLSHSQVLGATMQPFQALNGTYSFPATTERNLSEADQSAIRSLYGGGGKAGSVEGRIQNNIDGNLLPAAAAHVWIEDLNTGKVMASGLTSISGRFSLNGVPPGNYRAMLEYLDGPVNELAALLAAGDNKTLGRQRAFRSVEISGRLRIAAERVTTLSYVLVPPQNSAPALVPRFVGVNGDLSTVPVPVAPGKRITLYVGGVGVDQIPGGALVFSSPFITVDASSLASQQMYNSTPVISFDVVIAPNTPSGDYTIRLQSNSGETAYLVGGIKVNSPN